MSKKELDRLKQTLEDSGIEVYGASADEIEIAERIRLHLMDSGVRVRLGAQGGVDVCFTVRAQRSDFPSLPSDELFEKVRKAAGTPARQRGYDEVESLVREIHDPVDGTKVLDVWHEILYRKHLVDEQMLADEVRWAIELEKYVGA